MTRFPDLAGLLAYRYVNPFRNARGLQVGRVDMGVDYHGVGPIVAPGRMRVVGIGGDGWPGGCYLHLQFRRGRHKGRHMYIAEAIKPTVKVGQIVRRGRQLCTFGANAAPGRSPGIEIGWASQVTNRTLAAATTGYHEGEQTPAGICFARFLHHVGCPAPSVPNAAHGREYPL